MTWVKLEEEYTEVTTRLTWVKLEEEYTEMTTRLTWVKLEEEYTQMTTRLTWVKLEVIEKDIFSSPEPLGSQGELIVYPYSGVRCPLSSSSSSTMFKHLLL